MSIKIKLIIVLFSIIAEGCSHNGTLKTVDSDKKDKIYINTQFDDILDCIVVVRSQDKTGSGFLINESGILITNYHIVSDNKDVIIETRNGEIITGTVMDKNKKYDLALIKSMYKTYKYIRIGYATNPGIGNSVLTFGTPKSLDWSVNKTSVSLIKENNNIIYIQTDSYVEIGNSGGPLIDLDTKLVVGVVTSKIEGNSIEWPNSAVSARHIRMIFPYVKYGHSR